MELRNFFKKKEIKDIAKKEQDFYQKNTHKKFLKIFAASGLALITCATTLLATAPFGTGTASAATNSNLSNTTQTISPLGLDPENDPVVYTTSSGLEIKYANGLYNTYADGYSYFTLGTYQGEPVNWIIIGYDSSLSNFVRTSGKCGLDKDPIMSEQSFIDTIDNSAAGNAILSDMFFISPLAVQNEEIGDECVLVLSELCLGNSIRNTSSVANYNGSALQTYFNQLFETNLGLTEEQRLLIQPRTFTTKYYVFNGSLTSETNKDQYLFPLACRNEGEGFDINTYLKDPSLRITYDFEKTVLSSWRLRSGASSTGYRTGCVYTNGEFDLNCQYNTSTGARPSFVIKIPFSHH